MITFEDNNGKKGIFLVDTLGEKEQVLKFKNNLSQEFQKTKNAVERCLDSYGTSPDKKGLFDPFTQAGNYLYEEHMSPLVEVMEDMNIRMKKLGEIEVAFRSRKGQDPVKTVTLTIGASFCGECMYKGTRETIYHKNGVEKALKCGLFDCAHEITVDGKYVRCPECLDKFK